MTHTLHSVSFMPVIQVKSPEMNPVSLTLPEFTLPLLGLVPDPAPVLPFSPGLCFSFRNNGDL